MESPALSSGLQRSTTVALLRDSHPHVTSVLLIILVISISFELSHGTNPSSWLFSHYYGSFLRVCYFFIYLFTP